jgi:glycosyltransferase involved in cell wall biosynthesis
MVVEFCLPIYNEQKILKHNVLQLADFLGSGNFNFQWQIRLAINGTTDNSPAIAARLTAERPQSIKISNIDTAGKGLAVKSCGQLSQADIFVYMDIDLAVALDDIPALLKPLLDGEADLVVGSRLLPESRTERSYLREASSQIYNFLSKIILRHNFSDLQCGFKAIRVPALKKIAPLVRDGKWFFDTELIIFARYLGFRIKEIPVKWSENRYEKRGSKIRLGRDSLKFIINLLKLRFRLYLLGKQKISPIKFG